MSMNNGKVAMIMGTKLSPRLAFADGVTDALTEAGYTKCTTWHGPGFVVTGPRHGRVEIAWISGADGIARRARIERVMLRGMARVLTDAGYRCGTEPGPVVAVYADA